MHFHSTKTITMSERRSLELYSKFNENPQLGLDKLLVEASSNGDIDTVIDLLQKGADTNAAAYLRQYSFSGQHYQTPLIGACLSGNAKLLKLLLENGADPNATDCYSMTPLHHAAGNGHRDCLLLLIKNDANIHTAIQHFKRPAFIPKFPGGTTALHLAATCNHPDIIEDLILRGADYNQMNKAGITCLNSASSLGNEQSVLKLLECAQRREDLLEVPDKFTGNTPLHDCVRFEKRAAVEKLVCRGSDVNVANRLGCTPFLLAIDSFLYDHHYDNFECIVTKSIDLDLNSNQAKFNGFKPLHMITFCSDGFLCAQKRNAAAILLVRYGADVNIKYETISLLQHELYCAKTDDLLEIMTRALMHFDLSKCQDEHIILPASYCRRVSSSLSKQRLQRLSKLNSNPRSLQHCCRFIIRTCIGSRRLNRVHMQDIPNTFKDYLLLKS